MSAFIQKFSWVPRILCILAILFLSLFALDSFDPKLTFLEQLGGFFIHLIPVYILILFLVIAWKWELIGGMIFIILALGFTPMIYTHNYAMNGSVWISLSVIAVINFPFVVVGGLFILSHFLKKKNQVT